jgi:hypothetical protein
MSLTHICIDPGAAGLETPLLGEFGGIGLRSRAHLSDQA